MASRSHSVESIGQCGWHARDVFDITCLSRNMTQPQSKPTPQTHTAASGLCTWVSSKADLKLEARETSAEDIERLGM